MLNKQFFTSESVTEGHPDKICDQISDAVLDAIIEQDPNARVACETCCTTGMVMIMGEISTNCYIDIPSIARNVVLEIGYDRAKYGFDGTTCSVLTSIDEQSSDIAMGVDHSLETKEGKEEDNNGAGDQGMMFGYACDETPELMPLSISLAHRLAKQLTAVRKDGTLDYLRPDGKTQVTIEYENDVPKRVDTIVISTQHSDTVELETIRKDLKKYVIDVIIDPTMMDENTKIYINPTGRFVIGGPQGDSGLTGRKIIVDTYGGIGRHGGGAEGNHPLCPCRAAAHEGERPPGDHRPHVKRPGSQGSGGGGHPHPGGGGPPGGRHGGRLQRPPHCHDGRRGRCSLQRAGDYFGCGVREKILPPVLGGLHCVGRRNTWPHIWVNISTCPSLDSLTPRPSGSWWTACPPGSGWTWRSWGGF